MDDYQFTDDWFHWAPALWQSLVPLLPARRAFLEIGSYEGRSMVWMAENMVATPPEDSAIFCIDTWAGGEEHANRDMAAVEARFDHNVSVVEAKKLTHVVKAKGKSTEQLALKLSCYEGYFDFAYIDGSHVACDVLTDACMAWPLLKPGGLLVLDDYLWGDPRDILHRPKLAIDAFMNVFAEKIDVVHIGYQVVVKKKEA
jgi:predicted O-methyltransferase YrrM